MIDSLHSLLIYRVQAKLQERGYCLSYDTLSYALNESLHEVDKEVPSGDYVTMPSGNAYTKG